MSKHTPGPWWIKQHPEHLKDTLVESKQTGEIVAQSFSFALETAEYNALLIAAAPDLLKVCKASKDLLVTLFPLFEAIDKGTENTDYANGMKTIIGTLKLVIDKAEGEENE